MQTYAIALTLLLSTKNVFAETISIASWNVESGDNNPAIIAQEIEDDFIGIDLWGLSEVNRSSRNLYRKAASNGEGFSTRYIIGRSGGGDRLMIIYNSDRFTELEAYELDALKFGGGRAPLVAKFKLDATGLEFLFMVNHLHRKSAWKRNEQAKGLVDWVSQQTLPVVAVGDYNFDYDVPSGPGNAAYDHFIDGNHFDWVVPSEVVSTQYSDEDNDSENDHNSILDFVFTSGEVSGWTLSSTVHVREEDFPDDKYTSDHRPVLATIQTMPGASALTASSIAPSVVEHGRTVGSKEFDRLADSATSDANTRSKLEDELMLEIVKLRLMIETLLQDNESP